jgi:tetratricopeptide (TPR) repeat protein
MAMPNSSVPLRRAYGQAMTYLGFSQLRDQELDKAVKTLEVARETYRSIDGLQLGDLPAAAAFAEASAWQVEGLQALGRNDEARRVGAQATQVAGQILERRPGHMVAIRSRALITNSLAQSEMDELQLRKALALNDASGRDWEAIVKIDPTNQIAWNNLAGARSFSAYLLQRMGRIGESEQQLRAALALGQQTTPSAMIGATLSIAAAATVALEADLGNRQAAEAALPQYARLVEIAVRDLRADSFERSAIREIGIFGLGILARYALPVAAADYQSVRTLAQASLQRIEALKPRDPLQELIKNRGLNATYSFLAEASYNLKDYPQADKELQLAIDHRRRLPKRTLQDARDASDEQVLAAMIAARAGRHADAQQIIDPVLKFHRGLYARNHDDLSQHVEIARALYASGLSGSAQASSQLAEAAAIIDRLPPQMSRQTSIARLRGWIAEEQKTRR